MAHPTLLVKNSFFAENAFIFVQISSGFFELTICCQIFLYCVISIGLIVNVDRLDSSRIVLFPNYGIFVDNTYL
jgi:hypothetical protein